MGFTETITIEDKDFSVFCKIPITLNEKIEPLYFKMEEFQKGEEKMSSEALRVQRQIIRILLKEFVTSPQITDEIINDNEHELQPYLFDLGNRLFFVYTNKYASHMNKLNAVKKKLGNSDT